MEIEDGGVYEGPEGVKKVFCGILSDKRHMTSGFLGIHRAVNPLLEINKDRTRAKGLWHSHGSVSFRIDGKLTAFRCLWKYDMEYIKEAGLK